MGRSFEFKCPKCNYSAWVSGSVDFGFCCVVSTISCKDCQKLYDAGAEEKPGNIRNDIKAEELTGLACEEEESHAVTPWAHPGPCPQCGTTMEKGPLLVMWD